MVFSSVGTYAKSRKAVSHEIVTAVREFVNAGRACEKHLADQLLVPLEVCGGNGLPADGDPGGQPDSNGNNGMLDIQKETRHYVTNRDVIRLFKD